MRDGTALHLFIWILTNVDRNTGEVVFGRFIVGKELKINPNTLKSALWRLIRKYKVCTISSSTTYTTIRLINWDKYQAPQEAVTTSVTKSSPTRHQPVTTLYTRIKNKNKEYIYNTYFLAWLEKFNKLFQTEYKPTKTRNELYNLRRKTFKVEEMERALVGMSKKGFYSGENDSGWKADPDFILKTDEQIDKFLNMFKGKEVSYERIDPATVKF